MLRKLKPLFLTFLSALLLTLPFANGKLWVFAWFGFVPLFLALKDISRIKAFLLAYLSGVFFWFLTIYWLVHVTLLGTIVLVLYLALYSGVFGIIFTSVKHRAAQPQIFFIAFVWVLLEYLRSYLFTGFPWALLAYSQYINLPVIQIADFTGAWGVSFLIMLVNVSIYLAFSSHFSILSFKRKYLVPVLFILISLTYGYYKLYLIPSRQQRESIRISVIQGNIPQELKWDPSAVSYILNQYARLSQDAIRKQPDLIIWPEASSPGLLGVDDYILEEIVGLAKNLKTPLLIGTVSRDGHDYFNSAILIGAYGEIFQRYDKLHLVPFGEYIPLKKYFPFLETIAPIGDINKGKEYTIFQNLKRNTQNAPKFAVLICFEDLFPELSRKFIQRGAQFLVNITNDAWYKETTAPYQHLQASVFRAIENRVFLARAANTGISGFIAPTGKIISVVHAKRGREIFTDGDESQEILLPEMALTFYNRFGDYFVLICLILGLCIMVFPRKQSC